MASEANLRLGRSRSDKNSSSVTIPDKLPSFFGNKFSEWDDIKKDLPLDKQQKIDAEYQRFQTLRKRFSDDPRKAVLLQGLELSFKEWKKEVHDRNQRNTGPANCQKKFDEQPAQNTIGNCQTAQVASTIISGPDASSAARPQLSPPDRSAEPSNASQTEATATISSQSTASIPTLDEDTTHPFDGFRVGCMHFEEMESGGWKGCDYEDEDVRYEGKFPHQKISVHDALESRNHNPFKKDDKRLKYFHFPANHMGWIEEAVTRYYEGDATKANHLLSSEYWRGQLHGSGIGKSPIHAMHMRSRCSSIPLDTQSGLLVQKDKPNFALFLPYLHWETNKRRDRMASIIREVTRENEKDALKSQKSPPTNPPKSKKSRRVDSWHEQRLSEIVLGVAAKFNKKTKLGQYLFNAAEIYDMMDYEADERLVRNSLKREEPTLHIRRTLDQSYFLTLEDTTARDKDQVVYRATKPSYRQPRNITRVVMVDQLWLWILDERTIITSFPRRWGRNKPDSSGVHRSLRERLQHTNKIQSVYHLALLIIDQCSRVFFDRTQPTDLRPEVMDLFAEAIGKMTDQTTHAFQDFWKNVQREEDVNALKDNSETAKHAYLSINPEGKLLREAQDIAEELRIMRRIYSQQINVMKDFKKYLSAHHHTSKRSGFEHKELGKLQKLLAAVVHGSAQSPRGKSHADGDSDIDDEVVHTTGEDILAAEDFTEQIKNRMSEITELEGAIGRTTDELQELLSLKQQQASIVEAKAALERADESVRQGRTIMAFTIVTIIFLPLGFIATFFGMNNWEINKAEWMGLNDQLKWMFGASAVVYAVSLGGAFTPWDRLKAKHQQRRSASKKRAKQIDYYHGRDRARENTDRHARLKRIFGEGAQSYLSRFRKRPKGQMNGNIGDETELV